MAKFEGGDVLSGSDVRRGGNVRVAVIVKNRKQWRNVRSLRQETKKKRKHTKKSRLNLHLNRIGPGLRGAVCNVCNKKQWVLQGGAFVRVSQQCELEAGMGLERREGQVNAKQVMVETYECDSKNHNAHILQGAVLSGDLTHKVSSTLC